MPDTDVNEDGITDADDLEQAILASAVEGISSVSTDGLTVTEQSLDQRLKVLERQQNSTAASLDGFGMRHRQLRSGAGGFP